MSEQPSKKERTVVRLALLKIKHGPAAFNEWRVGQKHRWLKLTEQNFDGLKLDGSDFHGMKLTGSSFRGASLAGANFISANVNKVDFTNATLDYVDFLSARMDQTILDGAFAEGANFFRTFRDGWSIKGLVCQRCWITKGRADNRDNPDLFKPGELEATYGGVRVRVIFPGGFQPIDLMALPFYVKSFAEKFAGKNLVFAGLNTLETPCLEFRVEDAKLAAEVAGDMQQHLNERQAELQQIIREELGKKDGHISQLISSLNNAFETIKEMKMIINNNNTGPTFIQDHGVQAVNANGSQFNFDNSGHREKLVEELEQLIKKLPSQPQASEAERQSLSDAIVATKTNDRPGVVNAFKKGGTWLLKFANDVGVALVAEAVKQTTGMP
jgi:hypothetical protein